MPRKFKITPEMREQIKADYHTGYYTQRDLAHKYKLSVRSINLIVKGAPPKNAELIDTELNNLRQMLNMSKYEAEATQAVIEEKAKHLRLINSITVKNILSLYKKITDGIPISDHKLAQDTIDRAAITLGVADRHPKQINVNAQQNNNIQIDGFEFDLIDEK